MTTVREIQAAITHLSPEDFGRFREWFEEFEAAARDKQFEDDVRAGRLGALADEARDDLKQGRCTPL